MKVSKALLPKVALPCGSTTQNEMSYIGRQTVPKLRCYSSKYSVAKRTVYDRWPVFECQQRQSCDTDEQEWRSCSWHDAGAAALAKCSWRRTGEMLSTSSCASDQPGYSILHRLQTSHQLVNYSALYLSRRLVMKSWTIVLVSSMNEHWMACRSWCSWY